MQRKKNRKRQQEKRTQRNNEKKLEQLKKIRANKKTDSRGNEKKTKPNLISNIPKEGQRNLVLKMKGHGMGADYKKSEKKAEREVKKWRNSKEYKDKMKKRQGSTENKKDKLKIKSKWIKTKKGFARRGTRLAREAERREEARKKLGNMPHNLARR